MKDLNETEQEQLSILCQVNDTINNAYRLTQDFLRMVRKLQGIERDKAAVQAGLTLPYSNGVVEGHVNRLKLIKRMMYGRARFPLLRQRVLHCA